MNITFNGEILTISPQHKEQCKDFYFYHFNTTIKVEILAVFVVLEGMSLIFHLKKMKMKKEKVLKIGKKVVQLPLLVSNTTINVEKSYNLQKNS